jgi:hypothetical protein
LTALAPPREIPSESPAGSFPNRSPWLGSPLETREFEKDGAKQRASEVGLRGASDERSDESRKSSLNSVLVEVDKAENWRGAYPNYFLDVATFASNIANITSGGRGSPIGPPVRDLSFLRGNWKKRPVSR